jgi:hypothetical protein
VTNLEESLRDYYTAKADQLVLPDRVLDVSGTSDDASVSYISIGPDPRRRAPMLLAAAASIALLAGAGVLSRNGDTERGPLVVSNATTVASPVDMPLFAATWLPDGYVLAGGTDSSDNSYPAHTLIYRDRSQPLGSPAILISVDTPQPDFPGSKITIQGRSALDVSTEKNAGIVMTDPSGVGIMLSGNGVDMNQLRQVAETVKARSARPADGIDVGGLPKGFEKVGDYVGTTNSRMVDLKYRGRGSSDEQITVEVTNVDLAFEEIVGAMSDSAPIPVTVRGHNGFQIRMTTPIKQTTIAWKETPQTVAAVFSPGMAPEVLTRVAEGLKTISPDELKQFLSMPEPAGLPVETNREEPVSSPSAAFICADHDATAPQGQRPATCSDLYRAPLWPTWLPNGFALSQIERTAGAPSDNWMLQYTTSVPGVDGLNDILLTITASPPNGLDGFRSSVTGPPLNARVVATTVRGHEAFIFSDPTGQNHSVGIAWMETPSQLVELESSRVSIPDLRQLAEGLGALSTDDWTTKLARNELLLKSAAGTPSGASADVASTSTTTP